MATTDQRHILYLKRESKQLNEEAILSLPTKLEVYDRLFSAT